MGFLNKFIIKKPDFNTIEGIRAIPIPKYQPVSGIQSPVDNIEYILQRKATEHKKNGHMDLAIECLRKSNEIFPHSNFKWQSKDYLRLIKYLEQNGQHQEAEQEKIRLEIEHPELFDQRIENKNNIVRCISRAKECKEDLVYVTSNNKCPICSKFNNKIFSISGKSKYYTKLPNEFIENGGFCKSCPISMTIKFKGIN